ncbi:MAG: ABC transporter ATP-binding protein [Lachnospiraceae bacterium]|nr:ABC transporter ATP-binding protein [Lachnospiraceae bacterium]
MVTVNHVKIGYEEKVIVPDISLSIKEGEMVTILGPNGSGKSTVLKAVCRLLKHQAGEIMLQHKPIGGMSNKEIAQVLSVLAQVNTSPEDMTVKRLVEFGRLPHRSWYEPLSEKDRKVVEWAITETRLKGYEERRVTDLSGGERQRAWIAMCLAQQPKILFLDEPTTYLDISHQYEVMNLLERLNKELGMTIVMVLHDLNQAIRYSDTVFVMKQGKLIGAGAPEAVLTKELIKEVYTLEVSVLPNMNGGCPLVVPCC